MSKSAVAAIRKQKIQLHLNKRTKLAPVVSVLGNAGEEPANWYFSVSDTVSTLESNLTLKPRSGLELEDPEQNHRLGSFSKK